MNELLLWWLAGLLANLAVGAWIILDKRIDEHDRPERWFLVCLAVLGVVPPIGAISVFFFLGWAVDAHTWVRENVYPWLSRRV